MRRTAGMLFFIIALSSVLIAPTLFADDTRIAVLEFQNMAKMTREDMSYLAELFRGIAVPLRSKGYIIMTKENMISLLPPNKKLEQCVGECEVETGRKLGAHYIVAGAVYKIGDGFRLLVKLYETKGGSLVSSSEYDGKSVGDVAKKVKEDTASDIFKPLRVQGVIASDRTFGKDSQEAWDPKLEETTVVEFSSVPDKAQVIIDNIPKCNTLCSAELTLGRHSIVLTLPRYLPYQEEIDVKKGMAKIERKLEKNFGFINVTSKPEGLSVYVNQKLVGKTPIKVSVDPGKHVVTIKSDQYYEKGMEFALKRGEEKSVVLEPVAKVGALEIKALDDKGNALKAEVVIDGKSAGETPLVLKSFLIGQHSIVIKKDGFAENKQDVKIEEKKVTKHEVKLSKGNQVVSTVKAGISDESLASNYERDKSNFYSFKLKGGTVEALGASIDQMAKLLEQLEASQGSQSSACGLVDQGKAYDHFAEVLNDPPAIRGAKTSDVKMKLSPQAKSLQKEAAQFFAKALKASSPKNDCLKQAQDGLQRMRGAAAN